MKQIQYTEEQKLVWKLMLDIFEIMYLSHLILTDKEKEDVAERIRKKYNIPKPIPTLRQFLDSNECGSYHTFHFRLKGTDISVNGIGGFLQNDICHLFKYIDKFYVVKDERRDNAGDCTNYHCDHYLTLEFKED